MIDYGTNRDKGTVKLQWEVFCGNLRYIVRTDLLHQDSSFFGFIGVGNFVKSDLIIILVAFKQLLYMAWPVRTSHLAMYLQIR
jgi:hypothetical protein